MPKFLIKFFENSDSSIVTLYSCREMLNIKISGWIRILNTGHRISDHTKAPWIGWNTELKQSCDSRLSNSLCRSFSWDKTWRCTYGGTWAHISERQTPCSTRGSRPLLCKKCGGWTRGLASWDVGPGLTIGMHRISDIRPNTRFHCRKSKNSNSWELRNWGSWRPEMWAQDRLYFISKPLRRCSSNRHWMEQGRHDLTSGFVGEDLLKHTTVTQCRKNITVRCKHSKAGDVRFDWKKKTTGGERNPLC
jgi:hypothetical protein